MCISSLTSFCMFISRGTTLSRNERDMDQGTPRSDIHDRRASAALGMGAATVLAGSLGGQEQALGEYKYSRRVFRGSSRGTAGHRVTPNGVHFACVYAMLRVFSGGCVGPQKRVLNHLSYVQFVSGAPNEITLASYCQRSLQQHHVRYTVRACTQALHRAFAMNTTHDLSLFMLAVRIPSHR
jgi:hypothetical protein